MRTRFLTTDYFTPAASSSSSSSSSKAPETLTFLHLPVPHLPLPTLCNFEDILCSSFSVLSSSLTIDRLPIDAALSGLFSDVLPHNIDGRVAGFSYDEPRSYGTADVEIRDLEVQYVFEAPRKWRKGKQSIIFERTREFMFMCWNNVLKVLFWLFVYLPFS